MRALAPVVLACAAYAAREAKPFRQGLRTLALVQDTTITHTHSRFLDAIKAAGHKVTVKTGSETIELERFNEPQYDNILVLASHSGAFASVDVTELTDFADNGGNLFVAAGPGVPASIRKLASEFGVDYDVSERVIDHVLADTHTHTQADASHTRVLTNAYINAKHVVGAVTPEQFVVYEGVGMSLSRENVLGLRILTASPTGYAANPDAAVDKYPASVGSDTVLVAGIQARNNARAVFVGSLSALSDDARSVRVRAHTHTRDSTAANGVFFDAVARWAFQQSGVLRASNLRHAHTDGSPAEWQVNYEERHDSPPAMFPLPEIARTSRVYRIKDDISFAVDVHSYNGSAWAPYAASDMQLEFVMLDPYVRTGLRDAGNGTFGTVFRVPDVYGIYHFRVMYRRPGLTTLYLREQVSVRPFRHNEYERYILSAYPYYAASFAMMAAVYVFSFLFLYTDRRAEAK